MKRRSKSGHETSKSRPPTAAVAKPRNAPKAVRNRGASIISQETVVARLTHERDEALLRETANSEILRLISKSPDDLESVFRTILEHATRICNANFGMLLRFDGKRFRFGAGVGMPRELTEYLNGRGSYQPVPGSHLERVMRTKRLSHTADYAAEGVASARDARRCAIDSRCADAEGPMSYLPRSAPSASRNASIMPPSARYPMLRLGSAMKQSPANLD